MAREFTNIIDYARKELETFEQRPLCRVDSLIFSWVSYYRLPKEAPVTLSDASIPIKELLRTEWLEPMCERLFDAQSSIELLMALAASPRFRDVRVCGYESRTNEQAEQQFAAMTFLLPQGETFVAYRGTDNTLVGWKEDFNMAFKTAVPSQIAAARYLDRVAQNTRGQLWCGGHSKGGNMAVFAGMTCSPQTRARLNKCFSHDGPGFSAKTIADPRWVDAPQIADKTIPQSSVIGMIFENQEQNYTVVHSHSKGFNQHDPFSWEVNGCDFALENKLGLGAIVLDSSVNAWLANATDEQREGFVDAIFSVFEATGESSFADIKANWRTAAPKMAAAAAKLDAEDRGMVLQAVSDVTRALLPSRSRVEQVKKMWKAFERKPLT